MSDPIPDRYPPPFSYRWLAPRHWPTWLGMGLLWLLTWAPGGVRRAIGGFIGAQVHRRNRKRRAIVDLNLAWCFPELTPAQRAAMAARYFRLLGQSLLDYGVLWWRSPETIEALVRLEGLHNLTDQLAAGRRVILMTGHSIGLDFGAAVLNRRFLMAGMFKRLRNPVVDWAVAHGRRRFQGRLIPRDAGVRALIRALKDGHLLYHLPDEDLGPRHSTFAPFFGIPTATITGMGRMAALTDAVVVPYAVIYQPEQGGYVGRFLPPMQGYPSGDELQDAAAMNRALEEMIRMAPEQYMWSLRIFQTRPEGEPSPYAGIGRK